MIATEAQETLDYIPRYFRVITKADISGATALVPMVLWPTQKHYIENSTNRDICVKNRQTGFSTGVLARNSKRTFTIPYQRMSIITHDTETSEFLLQQVHRFHRHLDPAIKPKVDWSSSSRIRFPNLDNYIFIDSARSEFIGIGHTLNIAHLSEFSRWPRKKADELYAGISQTVPQGGFITIESTPRGRNLFYQLYQSAKKGEINYKPFFYEWWWDVTCVAEPDPEMKYSIEEEKMVEKYNLRPEQIAFRRLKMAELRELFFQEYPENDIDCWLSDELQVFDGTAIKYMLLECKPGRQSGYLTTWKGPIGGELYAIGVDSAGGYKDGDYSVASVIKVRNWEYVARFRARIPPDMFAEEVFRLGKAYNNALLGVEKESFGHVVLRILMEKEYDNLYHFQEYDDVRGEYLPVPGWKTSVKTKPLMIADFGAALRAGEFLSKSENLLDEAASAYYEQGRGESKIFFPPGCHDDELDAVMIALQVAKQIPLEELKDDAEGTQRSYASAF